jgi:hypothetical protein
LKRDLQNLISDLWTYKSCPTIKDFENRGVTMIDLGDVPKAYGTKEWGYINMIVNGPDTLKLEVESLVPTEYEDYYQCKTHKLVKSENI